jgi:membrane associated rhomboid family serine protease
MPMKTVTVERLTWVLIFGGLLVLSLSWFIDPGEPVLAAVVGLAGIVAACAGVALIFVRSRMKTGGSQ